MAVEPDGAPFGRTDASPLASVRLTKGTLSPGGQPVWAAELDGVHRHEMRRDDAGALVLSIGEVPVLRVDATRAEATLGAVSEAVGWQLATTFALPLAAQAAGAFVVHAAVAARDGAAVAICATSGTGKSSLLTALLDAGWVAVTEDLVVVRGGQAWPGPPWVRLAPGQEGPAGAPQVFRTGDKVGWGIAARTTVPTALRHIVLLDPPLPEPTAKRPAAVTEVIAALAQHTPWFEEPDRRGEALFGGAVQLARSVPATRLRLQWGAAWTDEAIAILADLHRLTTATPARPA